jgi:hypothetical protein
MVMQSWSSVAGVGDELRGRWKGTYFDEEEG